jgi:hypothetical protein
MKLPLSAVEFICNYKKPSNGLCRSMNGVSQANATLHLQELAGRNSIKANGKEQEPVI